MFTRHRVNVARASDDEIITGFAKFVRSVALNL